DKVLINDLRTNCIKIGSDNFYINMIKYFNNCIQIITADSDSNKIIIGFNIENDKQKNFINTITLSSRGDIQCNKLITNEIQCNNLHEHENKNLLDSITSNHLHTHHNLNTLNQLTQAIIYQSHYHENFEWLQYINQNLERNGAPMFARIKFNNQDDHSI